MDWTTAASVGSAIVAVVAAVIAGVQTILMRKQMEEARQSRILDGRVRLNQLIVAITVSADDLYGLLGGMQQFFATRTDRRALYIDDRKNALLVAHRNAVSAALPYKDEIPFWSSVETFGSAVDEYLRGTSLMCKGAWSPSPEGEVLMAGQLLDNVSLARMRLYREWRRWETTGKTKRRGRR